MRTGHIPLLLLLAVLIGACSTTRILSDGQYRLVRNRVVVEGDKRFPTSKLDPYVQQSGKGWSFGMCIYNWAAESDSSGWARFVHKLGTRPVVYDPDLLNASVTNLERRLEYLGYYHSRVRPLVSVTGQKVRVRYRVDLGKQYPIDTVSFSVPERGTFAEDFYLDTAAVTVRPGQPLSEEALEAESERSAAYFRSLGYYGFSKNFYSFEADTLALPGKARLQMKIREFTRNETEREARILKPYTFGTVELYYPETLKIREKILRRLTTIRPGDPYSEEAVARTYTRLSALRVLSNVNVELEDARFSTVDCRIHLTPSRLQGFKFNLEASTNSSGLFGIQPELSYYHKNIFHGGEVLNLAFMGNFQMKFNQPVRSTEFGVSAGISFPRFLGLPYKYFKGAIPRTDIKASYNYQNRPEYTRNIISTSFGYSGSHRNLYYQFYPVKLGIVHLVGLQEEFYASLSSNPFLRNAFQDHFDLGLGASLYYSTNTDVNPKTSYHYGRLSVDLAGNLLSAFKGLMAKDANGAGIIWNTPYSQYVRGEIQLGKTWRFGRNDNMAIATRLLAGAGYAYGNSQALPFEQHFYSGGAGSLRGWQARAVGPGMALNFDSFVIPNQTGDMKLEANVEFRFHAFWKLDGALFVDAGNVWMLRGEADDPGRLSASTFLRSIAADWGLGVRLDLGFILVRVDMGIQFHEPFPDPFPEWLDPVSALLSDSYAIHFGVGYPF